MNESESEVGIREGKAGLCGEMEEFEFYFGGNRESSNTTLKTHT